ncbi:hypothetical protein RB653_005090 [Dictyostelium firmibasis]|uniref:Cyclin-D1-binding protein 1 homolog n=1 Tax=Dictyostelium firmibasis TaxID=79012 RepID=A0AAN7U0P5_9MYCE
MNPNYDPIINKCSTFLDSLFNRNQDMDTFAKPTRAQIIKSAKTLSHEITKISLLLADLRAKTEYFSSIEETLDNVFSIYQGLSAYAGASLFRAIQIYFRKLIKSTQEVFIAYQNNEQSLGDDEENTISKQITGLAWKCCEEFEKVPIKNSNSIIARGEEISSLIQDALDEVKEFQTKIKNIEKKFGEVTSEKQEISKDGTVVIDGESSIDKDSNDKKNDDVNGEFEKEDEDQDYQDEEDDEDYDDDDVELLNSLTSEDIKLVDRIVSIIERSTKISQLWVEMLKSINKPSDEEIDFTSEQIEISESVISQINELSKNVDDIASAIYPLPNISYCEAQLSLLDVSIKNIIDKINSNFKLFNFNSKFENKLKSI